MNEIQFRCFRDWCKIKACEIFARDNLEDTFLRLCNDPVSYTRAFILGWEAGSKQETGLIK